MANNKKKLKGKKKAEQAQNGQSNQAESAVNPIDDLSQALETLNATNGTTNAENDTPNATNGTSNTEGDTLNVTNKTSNAANGTSNTASGTLNVTSNISKATNGCIQRGLSSTTQNQDASKSKPKYETQVENRKNEVSRTEDANIRQGQTERVLRHQLSTERRLSNRISTQKEYINECDRLCREYVHRMKSLTASYQQRFEPESTLADLVCHTVMPRKLEERKMIPSTAGARIQLESAITSPNGSTTIKRDERKTFVVGCKKFSSELQHRLDKQTELYRQQKVSQSSPELQKFDRSSQGQTIDNSVMQEQIPSNFTDGVTAKAAKSDCGEQKGANTNHERTKIPDKDKVSIRISTSFKKQTSNVQSILHKACQRLQDIELKRMQKKRIDKGKLKRKTHGSKEKRQRKLLDAKCRAVEKIIPVHSASGAMYAYRLGRRYSPQKTPAGSSEHWHHLIIGFEIRNFKSNSREVLGTIGEASDMKKVNLEKDHIERELEMFWDTESDGFRFSLKYTKLIPAILQGKTLPTKREILRRLITYYTIHARISMQNVWKTKIGWDDKIPVNLADNWYRWLKLLRGVESLKIPRWYSTKLGTESRSSTELHIFVDAGEDAYAAVAYLRISDTEGTECSLVGSKARVSPLRYLSNTRKELSAAVLRSRLMNNVKDRSLKIERKIILSDSTTVLTWLHSEHKRYSQFIAHRIGEILETTNLTEWRWISTKLNVADEATKWGKIPTFDASKRWFTGPEFQKQPEAECPPRKIIISNGTTAEIKASCSHTRLVMPSIVDTTKIATRQRLVRVVVRAKRRAALVITKFRKLTLPSPKLSQRDLMESQRKLMCQAQWKSFTEDCNEMAVTKLILFSYLQGRQHRSHELVVNERQRLYTATSQRAWTSGREPERTNEGGFRTSKRRQKRGGECWRANFNGTAPQRKESRSVNVLFELSLTDEQETDIFIHFIRRKIVKRKSD